MAYCKKAVACILLCCILFTCSGCNQIMPNLEELMRPPKLSKEQTEIYDALTAVAGKNIKLKYPKSGEERSAFTMINLDGDPKNEAVVFYNSSHRDENVRMNLLKQVDGKWISVCDLPGLSTDVDKVLFAPFGQSAINQLIVGFDLVGGNKKKLAIYKIDGTSLSIEYSEEYTYFDLDDLDEDEDKELFIINSEENKSVASIVKKSAGSFLPVSSCLLQSQNTTYLSAVFEHRKDTFPFIFIDSTKGVGVSTEVLHYRAGQLVQVKTPSETTWEKLTYRSLSLFTKDINLDKQVEIPTISEMPGYENYDLGDKKWLVTWNNLLQTGLEEYSLQPFCYTVMNHSFNYYFIMPLQWIDNVTVKENADSSEMRFVKYTGSLEFDEQQLLSIKVVQDKELNDSVKAELEQDGYVFALNKDLYHFYIRISKDKNNEFYSMSKSEVIASIRANLP